MTLSDAVHKSMTMRPTESRKKWKIVNTAGQGTPRDSALHMARHAENEGRPMTSRQYVGQCRGSRWARKHQEVAGQFMISGKMTSPCQ